MRISNFLAVANESISFQSDKFGKEIEATLIKLRNKKLSSASNQTSEERTTIQEIIKDYTGLKISLDFNTYNPPSVYLKSIQSNHIFFTDYYREVYSNKDAKAFFKKAQEVKKANTVNLAKAKVTGVFAEVETLVNLNIKNLFAMDLSPAHVTAILMHEIGHVFTYFEYMSRQQTTNQVLVGCMRSVLNRDTITDREFVFEQASKLMDGSEDSFKEIVKENDEKVITTVILKKQTDMVKSELGSDYYDFTACEQLADQFATRQGYGRQLIEALDVLYKGSVYKSHSMAVLCGLLDLIFLSYLIIVAATGIPMLTWFVAGVLLTIFFFSGSSKSIDRYDTVKTRYLRIKQQMIERLKEQDISKEETTYLITTLEKIDKIIAETYNYKPFLTVAADFIFPADRKVVALVDLHKQLEDLAMNGLFVKAAELKTL